MSRFGYISSMLPPMGLWSQVVERLPLRWRSGLAPLSCGKLSGLFAAERVEGWGWRIPARVEACWNERRIREGWDRVRKIADPAEISVIGLEGAQEFVPPPDLRREPGFPGISDGKALEMLIFITRFQRILKNHHILPHKTKVLIAWEEGNLGLTCARLIARDIRFLTLVHPNQRLLERAADLVMAETGISPAAFTAIPMDYRGARIVIQCGRSFRNPLLPVAPRTLLCRILQPYPYLPVLNAGIPVSARNRFSRIPLYPALGEAVIRTGFGVNYGFWCGPELPLERVTRLARFARELGMETAACCS